MALKAGYYGVKKNVLDELNQLDGAKIIKSVGAGLNLSSQGALSCKSATASQAGIAKSSDYLGKDVAATAPMVTTYAETGEATAVNVLYDTWPTDNTSGENSKLVTSTGVYKALLGKLNVFVEALTSENNLNDIRDTGIYFAKGSSPSNAPEGVTWFALVVLHISDSQNETVQVLFKGTTMYVRSYTGSPLAWQTWNKFTGSPIA